VPNVGIFSITTEVLNYETIIELSVYSVAILVLVVAILKYAESAVATS
jgi:hypothetical protein